MASVVTNYQGNLWLGSIGNNATTFYIALFKLSPTDLGSFTDEVSGGSYARQPTTFSTVSGKSTGNNLALSFTNMPTPSGTVHYVGVCRTLTGTTNDLLCYGQLNGATGVAWTVGQTFKVENNDIVITL